MNASANHSIRFSQNKVRSCQFSLHPPPGFIQISAHDFHLNRRVWLPRGCSVLHTRSCSQGRVSSLRFGFWGLVLFFWFFVCLVGGFFGLFCLVCYLSFKLLLKGNSARWISDLVECSHVHRLQAVLLSSDLLLQHMCCNFVVFSYTLYLKFLNSIPHQN